MKNPKGRSKVVMRCFLCVWLSAMLCSILLQFAKADPTPTPTPSDCAECHSKKQSPTTMNSNDEEATKGIADAVKNAEQTNTDTDSVKKKSIRIPLQASRILIRGGRAVGGVLNKNPPCQNDLSLVCDKFSGGKSCKSFQNNGFSNETGSVSVSSAVAIDTDNVKLAPSTGNKETETLYSGESRVESGIRLKLSLNMIAKAEKDLYDHADSSAYLELPQSFLNDKFKDGIMPALIGAAFDLKFNKKTKKTEGGILLYTSKDEQGCFHGNLISL